MKWNFNDSILSSVLHPPHVQVRMTVSKIYGALSDVEVLQKTSLTVSLNQWKYELAKGT